MATYNIEDRDTGGEVYTEKRRNKITVHSTPEKSEGTTWNIRYAFRKPLVIV